MKNLIIVILLAAASNAFSQDWPVKNIVATKKAQKVPFVKIPAFTLTGNKQTPGKGSYQVLKLNTIYSKQLLEERPEAIQISIPLSAGETITCDLVKFSLGNIKFTENNNDVIENIKIPATYRGIVTGEKNKNTVMLTVNEDYLSLIVTLRNKAIQVIKIPAADKSAYRLYDSEKIRFPSTHFVCGTQDKPLSAAEIARQSSRAQNKTGATADKCVNVFVDCFDSLYQWQSSNSQKTINFVYELFNGVATCYANEQINIQIAQINVWTTPDPYRGDTRENALADLSAKYQDNFWGNVCVGLDYSINAPIHRSGLAGAIGRAKGMSPQICPAYTVAENEFCYNDLNYTSIATVKDFPTGPNTTGAAIYLVTHEIGHLLGSRHTKWCGWKLTSNPDTYGALDSCGGMEKRDTFPICTGPPPPSTGATIMSYCVTNNTPSDFVSFKNGFGTIPGNTIRDFVNGNTCIPSCMECLIVVYNRNITDSFHVMSTKHVLENSGILPPGSFWETTEAKKVLYREESRKNAGSPLENNRKASEIVTLNTARLKNITRFKSGSQP